MAPKIAPALAQAIEPFVKKLDAAGKRAKINEMRDKIRELKRQLGES